MRCARHRFTQTDLFCNRCETPVCPRCLVHADVGIRCRKCSPPPPRKRTRGFFSGLFRAAGILILVVGAGAFVWSLAGENQTGQTIRPIGSIDDGANQVPVLTVTEKQCTVRRDAGTAECSGTIVNNSATPLSAVYVEVTWLDAAEKPIVTNRAFMETDPLPPGVSSRWQLSAGIPPTATLYRVDFRDSNGPIAVQE